MPPDDKGHVLFLTYHLPLGNEPGAFRPWMEARLLRDAGYQVTVVTSGVQYMTGVDLRASKGWCVAEEREGIRILRTWAPADHRRSIARRVGNYVAFAVLAIVAAFTRVGRIGWVFAGTDPIFLMPAVVLIAKVKRAQLVLDERDLFPETAIALGVLKEGRLSRALFRMQQAVRRTSTGIVASTPGIHARLLQYGIEEEKVRVLFNGDAYFDEDMTLAVEGESNGLRKQFGHDLIVAYAGGLGMANDVQTLLKAALEFKQERGIRFVVIGGGERIGAYHEFCRAEGLDHVHFLGARPRGEARLLLADADICVHMYPVGELFEGALASKIFDYLALGRPVVFAGSGDTREVLERSGAGLAVPSGDAHALARAIRRLWQDPDLRRNLGRAGRTWFEEQITAGKASRILSASLEGSDR